MAEVVERVRGRKGCWTRIFEEAVMVVCRRVRRQDLQMMLELAMAEKGGLTRERAD